MDRFWKGSGKILGGFGEDLGRVWAGFGKIFLAFQQILGRIDCGEFAMNVSREILINFVGSCDPRAAPPTRLASQCAGVSDPSACWRLFPRFPQGDYGAKLLQVGFRASRRRPGGKWFWGVKLAFVSHFSHFVRNFSAFLAHLKSSWHFLSIFFDFA